MEHVPGSRPTHAWGAVTVGIALIFGVVALGHQVSPSHTPWWVIPGLVAAGCFLLLGLFLLFVPEKRSAGTPAGAGPDGVGSRMPNVEPGGDLPPTPTGNVTTYGPTFMALAPGAHADHGSYTNVAVGTTLPPPPTAPPQVPISEEERNTLRTELRAVGGQIEAFISDWYVNPAEASRRSSGEEVTHENFELAMGWRNQHDADYSARYVKKVQPRVIDVYHRARIRGFFDVRVEDLIGSTDLGGVRLLGSLLVDLSARDLDR
jgi:hypothetical protein